MIAKLLLTLSLSVLGTGASTQAGAAAPVIHAGGKSLTVAWGGLTWHIPERLFRGVRTWSQEQTELWIQSGWNENRDDFRPVDMKGYDITLDVHASKVDGEDPRNALELIHRIHLPFTIVPIFKSAKINGMTYLGSLSSIHYFTLDNYDAYVSCRLITADKLRPPKVAPDVLSKKFTCSTEFYLPQKTHVSVSIWGVAINDAAPAFNAANRMILLFIR